MSEPFYRGVHTIRRTILIDSTDVLNSFLFIHNLPLIEDDIGYPIVFSCIVLAHPVAEVPDLETMVLGEDPEEGRGHVRKFEEMLLLHLPHLDELHEFVLRVWKLDPGLKYDEIPEREEALQGPDKAEKLRHGRDLHHDQ